MTCSSTPTTRAGRRSPTCERGTATRTRTTCGSGAWATRWTARGRSGHKTADEYGRLAVETARAMRQVDPPHRARRLRQLRPADADLRRLGGDRPRPRLRRRRLHQRARLLRGDGRRPRQLPRLLRRHGRVHPRVDRHRRPRRRQAPQPTSGSTCPSTSGTSGTSTTSSATRSSTSSRRPALIEDTFSVADAVVVGELPQRLPAPRRPGQDRLPGPARQRHRAHPHRGGRPGLAPDDLPPVRADRPPRPRHRPAGRSRGAPRTRPPLHGEVDTVDAARDLGRGERRRRACSSSTGIRPTPSTSPSTCAASRAPQVAECLRLDDDDPRRTNTADAARGRAAAARPLRPRRRGVSRAAAEPRVLDRRRPHRPPSLTVRRHPCRTHDPDHHRAHRCARPRRSTRHVRPLPPTATSPVACFLGSFGAVGASAALAACSGLEHPAGGRPVQRRLRQGRHLHRPQGGARLLERLHRR